jgi:hypothetical protein
MKKFIFIFFLLTIYVFSNSQIVYSIQVATFKNKEKANSFIKKHSELNYFKYRTDSGFWTIRIGKKKTKKETNLLFKQLIKKYPNNLLISNGIIVPSSKKKILQKIIKKKKNNNFAENLPKSAKSIIKITIPTLPVIEEIVPTNIEEIDTYTFIIQIHIRIYVIQFGQAPFSELANNIFEKKPQRDDLNTLQLSNSSEVFKINLDNKELKKSDYSILLPILNESRTNPNIRVKLYKYKM